MSKFEIGDKVYYIEIDYDLHQITAKSNSSGDVNNFNEYPKPFTIVAVKEIKTKYNGDTRIDKNVIYDLATNDSNSQTIMSDIEESKIYLFFGACLDGAKILADMARW